MSHKNKLFVFLALVGIVYSYFLLRDVPKLEPLLSTFNVSCLPPEGGFGPSNTLRGFGEVPGKYVSVEGRSLTISNPEWDVLSKVICGTGNPADPSVLLQQIHTYPDFAALANDKANYSLEYAQRVYLPLRITYVFKVIGLALLLAVLYVVGK